MNPLIPRDTLQACIVTLKNLHPEQYAGLRPLTSHQGQDLLLLLKQATHAYARAAQDVPTRAKLVECVEKAREIAQAIPGKRGEVLDLLMTDALDMLGD